MIVAFIGLNHGIISQSVDVGIVAMSLVTTMIPPVVIKNCGSTGGGVQAQGPTA